MTYQPPQWQPGQQPQYQQQAQYPQQAPPPYAPQPYQQVQPQHQHPGAAPYPQPGPQHPHQPQVYTGPVLNPRSQTVTQNRLAFILGTIFTVGIVGFVVIYNVFVV